MAGPRRGNAGRAPGAENTKHADFAADFADNVAENQSTEFPTDKRGLPIFDHAALEVLKAWRYFSQAGDFPANVAALLVIAWAIKGRLSC
ncbi:MAG: hypothetical protein Q8Q28_15420 [Pseudomonadota bacterium]|nr:hypothetical protein [Pseudomonadota bacterium]